MMPWLKAQTTVMPCFQSLQKANLYLEILKTYDWQGMWAFLSRKSLAFRHETIAPSGLQP